MTTGRINQVAPPRGRGPPPARPAGTHHCSAAPRLPGRGAGVFALAHARRGLRPLRPGGCASPSPLGPGCDPPGRFSRSSRLDPSGTPGAGPGGIGPLVWDPGVRRLPPPGQSLGATGRHRPPRRGRESWGTLPPGSGSLLSGRGPHVRDRCVPWVPGPGGRSGAACRGRAGRSQRSHRTCRANPSAPPAEADLARSGRGGGAVAAASRGPRGPL